MSDSRKFRFCDTPGGGRVAYSLFGSGKRKAFFFHGYPGSRHQAGFLSPHLGENDFEIASFDRPGFGHSPLFEASSVRLDLSPVLSALADSLGWKKFHLLAVSGGAPYALRSAAELGKRVQSVQVVCGLGPLHDREFRRHFSPFLLHGMKLGSLLPAQLLNGIFRSGFVKLSAPRASARRPSFLSPADFELLKSPEVRPHLEASLSAAFRQGVGGAQRDLRAFLSSWELDFSRLNMSVHFWHGKDDRLVPWQFSELLANRVPRANLTLLETEGHYTLPILRSQEILRGIP